MTRERGYLITAGIVVLAAILLFFCIFAFETRFTRSETDSRKTRLATKNDSPIVDEKNGAEEVSANEEEKIEKTDDESTSLTDKPENTSTVIRRVVSRTHLDTNPELALLRQYEDDENRFFDTHNFLSISSNLRHIAYNCTDQEREKEWVVIDGRVEPEYDYAGHPEDSMILSDGSYLYCAGFGSEDLTVYNGQVFNFNDVCFKVLRSDVGDHVITIDISWHGPWRDNPNHTVIFNGIRHNTYERVSDELISPDGKRLAYIAKTLDDVLVVVNGVEVASYDVSKFEISRFRFSPDSKHFLIHVKSGRNYFWVIDGEEQQAAVDDVICAPVGWRYVTINKNPETGKSYIVRDGQKTREYAEIYGCVLSRDGDALAYSAGEDEQRLLVTNRGEFQVAAGIWIHGFTGPGKKVVYSDRIPNTNRCRVYVGGEIQGDFEKVSKWTFSQDEKRFAFVGNIGDRYQVVCDGVPGKWYGKYTRDLTWSPDGRKFAYIAAANGKNTVVVDGVEFEQEFDVIFDLAFSPDSERLAYVGHNVNYEDNGYTTTQTIVIDNKAGTSFDAVLDTDYYGDPEERRFIVWDSPTRFHYMILDDCSVYVIDEEIVEE